MIFSRLIFVFCLIVTAGRAGAADIRVTTTPEYSTGRYGAGTRTNVYTAPLDVKITKDGNSIAIRAPLLTTEGPTSGVPGIGGREPASRITRETGLGDVRLTLTREVYRDDSASLQPVFDIGLQTRMPTATSSGLGSGLWQHSLRLGSSIRLGDSLTFDAMLSRRFVLFRRQRGSGTDYWGLYSAVFWDMDREHTVGLILDAQDRQAFSRRPVLELTAFAERQVTTSTVVGFYVSRGLTRESLDWAFGLRLSYRGTI